MLASYEHFVAVSGSTRWDHAAIDLTEDAVAWARLPTEDRERIAGLVAAFCLGETAVAGELDPFARRAPSPVAVSCFRLQQADEERHARFFDRVVREVVREAGRPDVIDPAFAELFEERLAGTAAQLDAGTVPLAAAVALYHMLLEGVVFGAGQAALCELLADHPSLAGMRQGIELVCRDERWHLGFGARVLQDAGLGDEAARQLDAEGELVIAAWGDRIDEAILERTRRLHRRRLRAAGLLPAA